MVFKNKSKKTDYLEPSSMITLPVETLACDIEVIEDDTTTVDVGDLF